MTEDSLERYVPKNPEPTGVTNLTRGLDKEKRRLAKRQLEAYLVALHHDDRFSVIASVRLIRLLSAPERISNLEACRRLYDILAIQRSRQQWGRVWSFEKMIQMTRNERGVWAHDVENWSPKKIAMMGRLDMTVVKVAIEIGKTRRGIE